MVVSVLWFLPSLLFAIFSLESNPIEVVGVEQEMTPSTHRLVSLIGSGFLPQAIEIYRKEHSVGNEDFRALHQMGLAILRHELCHPDPERQRLALVGADLSSDGWTTPLLLEVARTSCHPALQIQALRPLSLQGNGEAEPLLRRAMSSWHPRLRIEAALLYAEGRYPTALEQIETLFYKVDPSLYPLFPPLFAKLGSEKGMRWLRKLLVFPDEAVRVTALRAVADHALSSALPTIRSLATQGGFAQQEACAYVLGILGDSSSLPLLCRWMDSSTPEVALAACLAAHHLGEERGEKRVEELVRQGSLYAVYASSSFAGGRKLLSELLRHPQWVVRCNAAVALLESLREEEVPDLMRNLFVDSSNLYFSSSFSPGGTLTCIRPLASCALDREERALAERSSLCLRKNWLAKASLSGSAWNKVADWIAVSSGDSLFSAVCALWEGLGSPEAVTWLQRQSKEAAPLRRLFASATLLRMGEPADREPLMQWIRQQWSSDFLRYFSGEEDSCLQVEKQLFLLSLEALAVHECGVEFLLEGLRLAHASHRSLLSALLMQIVH